MSNIRVSINKMKEPSKSVGKILIAFYETMKGLEHEDHRGGKQATTIVMAINDIEELNLN